MYELLLWCCWLPRKFFGADQECDCFGRDLSNMLRPGEIVRHSDGKILVMSMWSDFAIADVVGKEVTTPIIVWTEGQQWAFGLIEEQLPLRTPVGELVEVRSYTVDSREERIWGTNIWCHLQRIVVWSAVHIEEGHWWIVRIEEAREWTPEKTGSIKELEPLMNMCWTLLLRYSWNHFLKLPVILIFQIFESNLWLGTEPNAFLKSKYMTSQASLLLRKWWTLSRKTSDCVVERYLRKPNWDGDIIPWDKTNLLRLS